YFRKIRPRTTCLYSAASMLLRSLSAASQSFCSKPMLAELLDETFDFTRAICRAAILTQRFIPEKGKIRVSDAKPYGTDSLSSSSDGISFCSDPQPIPSPFGLLPRTASGLNVCKALALIESRISSRPKLILASELSL